MEPKKNKETEALEAREGLAEDLCSEEISKTGASLDYVPRVEGVRVLVEVENHGQNKSSWFGSSELRIF